MSLRLEAISKTVNNQSHIQNVSLTLERGSLNVLLGETLSGKTSLMRLMAGLDKPTSGRILIDGNDVTGVSVRKRSVAMVYQQFINYPTLTVYENIASPLSIAGADRATIEKRVHEVADLLRLGPYLHRTPLALSGGQQQRTAIARAIVKEADLVLLDEPLANLDYKLREELRDELPRIFAKTGAVFVYATTEPMEALLLGGNTACLHEGRLAQFGPTSMVYRQPADLVSASVFSDPPLNVMKVNRRDDTIILPTGGTIPIRGKLQALPQGAGQIGIRAHHIKIASDADDNHFALDAVTDVTEITGSESFVHVHMQDMNWVVLAPGIHEYEPGATIQLSIDTRKIFVFDAMGQCLAGPDSGRGD